MKAIPSVDRMVNAAISLVVLAMFLAFWQSGIFHQAFGIASYALASPAEILEVLQARTDELILHSGVTFLEAALGYIMGSTIGLVIAVAAMASRRLEAALIPLARALISVPIIASAPLMILYFGSDSPSKVAVSTLLTAPTMASLAFDGLTRVDPGALQLLNTLAARNRDIVLKLRIPSALPLIFTALKLNVSLALIGAIITQFVSSLRGLGLLMSQAISTFDQPAAWAAMAIAAAGGIVWFGAVSAIERVIIPWHVSVRS